jgi:predicted membrane-bound spermidine synthase
MIGTAASPDVSPREHTGQLVWISVVFILSGTSALLYQVSWQRALFAIFGINIEAVTVVVTAFMLGLGVGSLLGGALSKSPRYPVLIVFAGIEGGIGLFGAFSLPIFHFIGDLALHAPAVVTAGASVLLVVVPTALMGATLPLLVAHAVRHTGNVGRSVGMLYFVNTLGSALAAFLAVLVFLPRIGLSGTVRSAAAINLVVAAVVILLHRRSRRKP